MNDIYKKIDDIDARLIALLIERLELCKQVAANKISSGLPLYDREREDAVVAAAVERAGDYAEYANSFINVVIGLSKRAGNEQQ